MPIGVEKIVLYENEKPKPYKIFTLEANRTVQIKAFYYKETPAHLRGLAKWILKFQHKGPFTAKDQMGKIGDVLSINLPPKFCGPKFYVIEAFSVAPQNKYPTQLVFRGIADERIVSTEWRKTKKGKDIRQQPIKRGESVYLHAKTEGLNGAELIIDVHTTSGSNDPKVDSFPATCIAGEINVEIANTFSWYTDYFMDQKFYIKVKKAGSSQYIKDKTPKESTLHARFLRIQKTESKTRQPKSFKDVKAVVNTKTEVNVERYELCRFKTIDITDDKQKITLFDEGKLKIKSKDWKKYFQVSETIHFDFNKSTIRGDAKKVLNGLANLLLDNPYIPAEIGAHCDIRGSHKYNDSLSQRRAESAVSYLASKGVSKKLLSSRGYGKRRLLVEGEGISEKEHQKNRRVTIRFKIFSGDAKSIVFETIAPDKKKKKEITINVGDYNTDKCIKRGTSLAHDTNVKVIELTDSGKKIAGNYDGKQPIKHRVFSSISKVEKIPLEYIWPHSNKSNNFEVYINSCRYYNDNTKPTIIVKAYPDIKWDFHFYAKLSNPLAVKWQGLSKANDSKMREVNGKIAAQSRWKQAEAAFGAVLKANWNKIDDLNYEKDFEVTAQYEDKFKKLYKIFSSLKEISKGITAHTKGKATKKLGSKQPFEVEMIQPNVCFGAEWMLARGSLKQKAIKEIGTEIKIYLKAEPILGVKLIIDLLNIVVTGASLAATGNTVAADIFIMVKDWAAQGYKSERVEISFDMWIDLILEGSINGGVDVQLNTASDEKKANVNLDTKISAELTAGVNLKAKVVVVEAGSAWAAGEASASAKMGITSGHKFRYETYKGLFYQPTLELDPCIGKVVLMIEVGLSYKVISADWKPINYNRNRKFWDKVDIIKKLEDTLGINTKVQVIKP